MDLSKESLCRPFFFQRSSSHGVLLLHGITGTCAQMLPLGQALADAGFSVKSVLLSGHGTTEDEFRGATWQDWLADAENGFDELGRYCKNVSVAGLSMGGTLSLLLAERRPVHCLIPIAAALNLHNRWAKLACLLRYPHNCHIRWGGASNTSEPLQEYRLGYNGVYASNVMSLNHLIKMVKMDIRGITCPVLAVRAGLDRAVRPSSADFILRSISSQKKQLLELKKSPHVCVLGPERELLFREIISFLRENG